MDRNEDGEDKREDVSGQRRTNGTEGSGRTRTGRGHGWCVRPSCVGERLLLCTDVGDRLRQTVGGLLLTALAVLTVTATHFFKLFYSPEDIFLFIIR